MLEKIFDVIIVGGGAGGLYSAFYGASKYKLSSLIIESLPSLGGQVTNLYGDKPIYDLPGILEIKASDFIDQQIKQIESQPDFIKVRLDEEVISIDKEDDLFIINTNLNKYRSKTIIISIGPGAFKHNKLELENEDDIQNIHYHVKDVQHFSNKEVVIFGGGDSALDWALEINQFAKKVSIVHRRDKYRAQESSIDKLDNSDIVQMKSYTPESLNVDGSLAKSIIIKKIKEEETVELKSDEIIVNFGVTSKINFENNIGLEIERNKILTKNLVETNVEGCYAVGDISLYKGKERRLISAFGEAMASTSIINKYIKEKENGNN